jgi:N,N'-diacetyllegionaminate synthase
MHIGACQIGVDGAPYVIAEIGVNHDGSVGRALELTDAAAGAGADAVKLQLFETDRLMGRAAKLAAYQRAAGETDPVAMLRRLELSIEEMEAVVERAHGLGVHAIVTVFSVELVGVAERVGWDAYKSASPDIVNRPLLEAMAATGKPLIVSTGASTMEEVSRAVGWLGGARERLALLQCVSCYPAPSSALSGISALARETGLPVGYSDHTPGVESGGAAVEAGACVLEKHLTYDVGAVGPDHGASLAPGDFGAYVARARRASRGGEAGPGEKVVLDCERDVREVSRQSLTTTRALAAGHVLGREDLAIKRPGVGIEPWRLGEVLGRRLARGVEADMPVRESDLAAG